MVVNDGCCNVIWYLVVARLQYIQKKDPSYHDVKEDTVWTMQQMNDYINEAVAPQHGLEQDWVFNGLTVRSLSLSFYFLFSSLFFSFLFSPFSLLSVASLSALFNVLDATYRTTRCF